MTLILLLGARAAIADEGGASFWLPGQMASFAAAPGEVGWSLPLVYYHTSSDAGGSKGNWLAYVMGGIPVGAYRVGRLANIGLNHWSLDAGSGYTE